MARTYLSQLVALTYALCKYITKYGPFINNALESPEKELFIALQAACTAFMNSQIPIIAKND